MISILKDYETEEIKLKTAIDEEYNRRVELLKEEVNKNIQSK